MIQLGFLTLDLLSVLHSSRKRCKVTGIELVFKDRNVRKPVNVPCHIKCKYQAIRNGPIV